MIEPGDPAGEPEARPRDLAVGWSKVLRPWLLGLCGVLAVLAILAIGANRPTDPTFADEANGATETTAEGVTFGERRIYVGDRCLDVQVANTPEQRAQGLKHRDTLGEYAGMLFEFENMGDRSFTMSEVRFPLTIGFYDDAGVRVDALDMEPCPDGGSACPVYSSKAPFRNALEVGKGQLPEGPYVPACPS